MNFRTLSLAAVALAGLSLSGGAFAQVKTWNFGDTTPNGACTGTYSAAGVNNANFGNVINCTQQPNGTTTNLWLSSFSTTGSNSTFQTAGVNAQGSASGVGVWNQSEDRSLNNGNHSMDNATPGIDMLLLRFSAAEILRNVSLGWTGTDGDFQVLRWTGDVNATASTVSGSIVGKQAGALLGAGGWELISTVDGQGGINTNPADVGYGVNTQRKSSSYWLITAYNSAFGGTALSAHNDAIKVLGVSTGISAPGTLALAGLGLLGMGVLRRRRA